ncbi:MAG: trimethylamine methyltransferase family protein [Bacillota bacterium]
MISNYLEQTTPFMSWVTESQLERIHLASLEILERTGTKVDNPQALKLLKAAGCLVKDNIVKIPSALVDECIRTAPKKITLGDRNSNRKITLAKNRAYFGTGSDLPFIYDVETGVRRYATLEDVRKAIRILDSLENFDFNMSYVVADDVLKQTSELYHFKTMVQNSIKPIIFTANNVENTEAIIEMAALAVKGYENLRSNPLMALYAEPISPLIHSKEGIGKMLKCHEYGIPVIYTPGMLSGATGPMTKAGTIALMNAEALTGVVISQLHVKNAPIIIGGGCFPMDMKSSSSLYGCPEGQMNFAVMTQLSKFYGIPNFTEAGCTNAPTPDPQAGFEAGVSLLMNQLSGANLVHDVGYLEGGKTACLPFLVMCNDYIGYARYVGKGIKINDDTLGLDAIDEAGIGNNFLTSDHTFRHFREEIWQPKYFNRLMWAAWEEKGRESYLDIHRTAVEDILSRENPNPLEEKVVSGLDDIVAKREKILNAKRN